MSYKTSYSNHSSNSEILYDEYLVVLVLQDRKAVIEIGDWLIPVRFLWSACEDLSHTQQTQWTKLKQRKRFIAQRSTEVRKESIPTTEKNCICKQLTYKVSPALRPKLKKHDCLPNITQTRLD